MELQHVLNTSADKLEVYVMCPGLTKEDVTISFDKKGGTLEIMGESNNKELNELITLTVSGKIIITPKYRSDDVKSIVRNGIATITFGLAEDVKLIKPE